MIARTRVLAFPIVDDTQSTDPVTPPAAEPAADNIPVDTAQAETSPAETAPVDSPPKRGRGRGRGSTARTMRTIELHLTVSGTADGEWQAELKQGTTWIERGLPVTAAAVLRAAQELHEQLAAPIDAVIGAAREHAAARVTALEAELEQARKALAEMEE